MYNNEIWKEIKGYEGLYEISNYGRVKSLSRKVKFGKGFRVTEEKILSNRIHSKGYLRVQLSGTDKYIHRLVAEAFLDNPNNLKEVNHIDEDKTNNNVDNLEWISRKDNCNHGTAIKRAMETRKKTYETIRNPRRISKEEEEKIIALFQDGKTVSEIAELTGRGKTTIRRYIRSV